MKRGKARLNSLRSSFSNRNSLVREKLEELGINDLTDYFKNVISKHSFSRIKSLKLDEKKRKARKVAKNSRRINRKRS